MGGEDAGEDVSAAPAPEAPSGEQTARGPVTREALYEEVWAAPMRTVAARHGVSGSFLTRICVRLNVPRPPAGHWAKLASGKPVKRIALPEVRARDELVWSRDGEPVRETACGEHARCSAEWMRSSASANGRPRTNARGECRTWLVRCVGLLGGSPRHLTARCCKGRPRAA